MKMLVWLLFALYVFSIEVRAVPVLDCSPVPESFPHGMVECTNSNKSGSVCEYNCTGEDYSVWPEDLHEIECLPSGMWSNEVPCCARPCPPYVLYDSVALYHIGGEGAQQTLQNMLMRDRRLKVAEDAKKLSVVYFSGAPRDETAIRFNEYGADIDRFLALAEERMHVENDGAVNTGAAIQYALDHLLNEESGIRDDRVPKVISIITNRNPDDDVTAAVAEAERRGVLIYVYGFETGGYTLDREKLLEMTGEEEHIFMYDHKFEILNEQDYAHMFEHFCRNPCDHVMHDHE